jgi:hypothetical protein
LASASGIGGSDTPRPLAAKGARFDRRPARNGDLLSGVLWQMSSLAIPRSALWLLTVLLLGWAGAVGAEAQALPPTPKPPADPGGQATFPAPPSLARGDQLDEWCKGMTTAINFAVCGDDELRKLALERLRAFNEANARLSPDQHKVLAADQNGWALSYPQACGLTVAEPPVLPLASSIKECLAGAGRKRLAYLRSYGLAGATEPPPAAAASPAPPAASSVQAEAAVPPPAAGDAAKSSAPAIRIPPTQQSQAAAAVHDPQSSGPARQEAKPAAASEKPAANDKAPTSSVIPDTAKIGALLIAVLVVGMWLGSGLRRRHGPNRHDPSSPTT